MQAHPFIEQSSEIQLLNFYGWWQFVVCGFAFIALMAIWRHIGRKQGDLGQVWLALSILCWSFSGAVEVYYAQHFLEEMKLENLVLKQSELVHQGLEEIEISLKLQEKKIAHLSGFRSIFSLFNSLFILLALPWFRYIPKSIEPIIKSKYWIYIVGLPFVFSLLPTVSKMLSTDGLGFISELDVYYSTLTLIFLGIVLWSSFAKRRLKWLAWLSVVSILITFAAQIYKLTGQDVNLILFSAIFKTTLIMIFFALALSWVKELAENVVPKAEQLLMKFFRDKTETGKYEQGIQLQGLPKSMNERIRLTPASFELLNKFAQRKGGDGEGWLEIKPKNDTRTGKDYDIKDYNEVKRLLGNLLDGIFGKANWTPNQHSEPWKNTFFELSEKRERKIRLAIPKENIIQFYPPIPDPKSKRPKAE